MSIIKTIMSGSYRPSTVTPEDGRVFRRVTLVAATEDAPPRRPGVCSAADKVRATGELTVADVRAGRHHNI